MPRLSNRIRRIGQGARNAVELLRGGRFSAPYRAPFELVDETPHARLRHYPPVDEPIRGVGPILLVPPLMVTAEVYDISPELSSVAWLSRHGLDVWLLDFGAPETEAGGMSRTLDDHVLSVDRALDLIVSETGRSVHLAGYSQGGMFVYQAAAYRNGAGLASLITFGSPVDIHRNVPSLRDDLAGRLIQGARQAVARPLSRIDGLPGFLTSTGFRVFSARKELQQMVELLGILHDRDALERRELRRRFIAGEGFVAWPGPALRTFIDEFIVANRMADGGFVINGKTVTLADIRVPILCFVGTKDEIARPASVRAIARAAPDAEVHEASVAAGHFGLVVGSRSLGVTWPTVLEWCQWRDGRGSMPPLLEAPAPHFVPAEAEGDDAPFEDLDVGVEFLYDLATETIERVWGRIGEASESVAEALDLVRWQLPRVARIRKLDDDVATSMALALSEQARAIGDATFFLYGGRAFTYAQADERVTNVARGLWKIGVRPGDRVAVVMSNRPTYLSLVAALSRIRAVAALIDPLGSADALRMQLAAVGPRFVVSDPERASTLAAVHAGPVHVLGGGVSRALPEGVVDMEAIDVSDFDLPDEARVDSGRGGDLALLVVSRTEDGAVVTSEVSNRRWALAALGTAAGCRLTTSDTVYLCLALHTDTAMLLAVGGALAGGARLALAPGYDEATFWPEIRRYGATAVFCDGALVTALAGTPRRRGEESNPVRVFVGTDIPTDSWNRLSARFRPGRIVQFYASSRSDAFLVNVSGEKVGSVGRPLPGASELAVVRTDPDGTGVVRDSDGRAVRCEPNEAGLLIARARSQRRGSTLESDAVLLDVFEEGDRWIVTGDLFSIDDDGDFWRRA